MNLQVQNNQGFAPVTLDEAMRFSDMLAKSQMVPKAYQGKPEDVLVAIQWGRELGLAPLQALQSFRALDLRHHGLRIDHQRKRIDVAGQGLHGGGFHQVGRQ